MNTVGKAFIYEFSTEALLQWSF